MKTNERAELTIDLLNAELAGFYGTANYYKHSTGLLYTDGVRCLGEIARAYWLIDAIALLQPDANKIDSKFQVWTLHVSEDRTAKLSFQRDSGLPIEIQQKINYTDFPIGSIKLFVVTGVLMLRDEY